MSSSNPLPIPMVGNEMAQAMKMFERMPARMDENAKEMELMAAML